MIALLVFGLLLLLGAGFPSWWVRSVLAKYRQPTDRYQWSGADVARDLLQRLEIDGVRVEQTAQGDHYDPEARCVRLTPEHYEGHSLTAVTVAAHEVGHAIQDAAGYGPLRWRTRLARWAHWGQRLGAGLLVGLPVILAVTRSPALLLPAAGLGVAGLMGGVAVHMLTLPVEFDASFRRAMPLLSAGYLHAPDPPHARRILRAAALTYVAAAAASLLNVWFWLRLLRPW